MLERGPDVVPLDMIVTSQNSDMGAIGAKEQVLHSPFYKTLPHFLFTRTEQPIRHCLQVRVGLTVPIASDVSHGNLRIRIPIIVGKNASPTRRHKRFPWWIWRSNIHGIGAQFRIDLSYFLGILVYEARLSARVRNAKDSYVSYDFFAAKCV